jgi:hypothetical protein
MEFRSAANHLTHVVVTCLALICSCASAVIADESGAQGSAQSLTIYSAETTLRRFCAFDSQGRLWLQLPAGSRFELITSTSDPDVINRGDGEFHPFDEAEVRAAFAEVRFPLRAVHADVFILPYPRRFHLESAAGSQLILLSPGVRPISRQQQHAEAVHELGHVVQYALMPDTDRERWNAYRRLRGIEDVLLYAADRAHAFRPHEIFAEDFRALFGGSDANYSGSIENETLPFPATVTGLAQFLLDVAGAVSPPCLNVSPNPARGPLRLSASGSQEVDMDLFDVSGRKLVTLKPRRTANWIEWTSDGKDADGRPFRPGLLFARPRGTRAPMAPITILP